MGHAMDLWKPLRLDGEACGIPHLARNERDVGHPAIGEGIEPKKRACLLKVPAVIGRIPGFAIADYFLYVRCEVSIKYRSLAGFFFVLSG